MQFIVFCFVFFIGQAKAQTSPLYLTWDNAVGCQVSENPDRKTYLELIEAGEHLRVCKNSIVNYTVNEITGSWVSTTWTVTGGTILGTPGLQNCQVKWNAAPVTTPSSAAISAVVHTIGGDINLPRLDIDLIVTPKAFFMKAPYDFETTDDPDLGPDIEACNGEEIFFANGSITNGGTPLIDSSWDFGDPVNSPLDNTSHATNPSHTYSQSGRYYVTLTVTNACNCKKTYGHYVHVGNKGVSITCPGVVCEGQKATYSLTAPPQTCRYFWSVDGGTIVGSSGDPTVDVDWTSFPHMSPDDGFGYVTITPTECISSCYTPTTLKVPVIRPSFPIKGDDKVCIGSEQRYVMPQWPTTDFVWTVINNDGTDASLTYTDQRNEVILEPGSVPGVIVLELVYQNTLLNCGGRSEITITIMPKVNITGPAETCIGEATYELDTGLSGLWTLKKLPGGPGTSYSGDHFAANFTAAGQYSLSVSGPAFCTPRTMFITVKSAPPLVETDVLGSRVVCPSNPSVFTLDPAGIVANTIIGWSVDPVVGTIIGGSYGNSVQVIFNYPIPVTSDYAVTVWRETTGDPACKSTDVKIPLALVPFDISPITGPDHSCASTYQDYTVAENDGDFYNWSIDPVHAGSITENGYKTANVLWNEYTGTATLKLKVTKCNVTSDEETLDVLIGDPHVSIVPPTGTICSGDPVNFSISGVPAITSGSISWDFGDGETYSGSSSPSHPYHPQSTSATTYTVKITITNPNGCHNTLTATTTVTVEALPKAHLSGHYYQHCTEAGINETLGIIYDSPGTAVVQWYKDGSPITGAFGVNYSPTQWGLYKALITNGTCTAFTDSCLIKGCNTCTFEPVPELSLLLTEDCGRIVATGGYTGTPALSDSFIAEPNPTSTTAHTATYDYDTPGYKTIQYVVTYAECSFYKEETKFIPYIANVGVTVTCGTGSTYNVTLNDTSLYYSGISMSALTYAFTVNGDPKPQLTTDAVDTRTLQLTPGALYNITLTISDGVHDPCTKEITYDLRDLPDADFNFTTECQGTDTGFTLVNNSQSGVTYHWDFGDSSSNTLPNPSREYATSDQFDVTLTVTDQFNCSKQRTWSVQVKENDQSGTIATPPVACPGAPSNLFLNDFGTLTDVTSYQWLLNNVPIDGATYNNYPADVSGSYSVVIGNINGCTRKLTQSVPVAIATPPITSITGPEAVCHGKPFTLSVYPGSDSHLEYKWTPQGQPDNVLSTTTSMTANPGTDGTFTYVLDITFPLGGDGFCTTTLEHTVTIDPEPYFTDLSFAVINCMPYTVQMGVAAFPPGGEYNWSDGQSGKDIFEDQGGVYGVTYTAPGGCTISTSVTVPKSPENFMWIFPYGCYQFCDEFNTGTLIGPDIIEFSHWEWHETDIAALIQQDNSAVREKILPSKDNVYNLLLQTGDCPLTSRDMTVDITDCAECVLAADLEGITISEEPYFHYVIHLAIANTAGSDMTIVITAPNTVGILTPGTVVVPPGGMGYDIWMVPDSGYTAAPATLMLTGIRNGNLCKGLLPVDFSQVSGKMAPIHEALLPKTALVLSPNPAKELVEITCDFGTEDRSDALIIIYDLYGRQLESYVPRASKETWKADLSHYPAGNYVVVMKSGDKILKQKKLQLVK